MSASQAKVKIKGPAEASTPVLRATTPLFSISDVSVQASLLVKSNRALLIILFIFTLLTLYQSMLLPIGEADDETDHYQYLRFVARTGHPPLTEPERHEAGFKGGLAPLYYWLTAWPIALVGEDRLPDIRRVDARPERHIPGDGLGINHILHTLDEAWPWQGQVLAWHLVRLLSLPLGWLTITATYALARRLQPRSKSIPIIAAAFIALLPRFVISSGVINDDNLVFALIALLLLTQVMILQEKNAPSSKIMATLGALFGLALVTKYFSLILLPEIGLTLWLAGRKSGQVARDTFFARYRRFLPFLITLFLTAGLWFIFIATRFNRIETLGLIPGLAASLGEPQITEGLTGLLSGQSVRPVAATYSPLAWFGLLYRSFWFEYGWMRVFAAGWVYALFSIAAGLALIGLVKKIIVSKIAGKNQATPIDQPRVRISSPVKWLLTLHLVLFIVVVLARYLLSATIDTAQGRHLYPALPVIAVLFATGTAQIMQWVAQASPIMRVAGYLIVAGCYLFPALVSLQPAVFVLPHYQRLPVTSHRQISIRYPQQMEFAAGLSLLGLEAGQTAAAGEAFPVRLYWGADREATQDYALSLCLQDEAGQPVACWRGQFAHGHYPARAWEVGDTVIDTIFLPVPACYRILDQPYQLHLLVWPLEPTGPATVVAGAPVLDHTFSQPVIRLEATDSLLTNRPQSVELWRANRQLTGAAQAGLRESLTQITYSAFESALSARFTISHNPNAVWSPLASFQTPLYLPCDDGPSPFAYFDSFVVDPTLGSGLYRSPEEMLLPEIHLSLRDRVLAPISSSLTFSRTLAPLSLELPNQQPIDLTTSNAEISPPFVIDPAGRSLPLTIRWQARRWMADPLIIAVKLLDKEFMVGGERIATLGDRYPNLLWIPTEIVEETYPLRLDPEAPPGLYRLELSILRQDTLMADGYESFPLLNEDSIVGEHLYPLTLRLLDPDHNTQPAETVQAQLGQQIELFGYELNPIPSDTPLTIALTLFWRSTAEIPADYTVFTQLLGPDGQVWAQWDNPPQAGRYPTSAWTADDRVIDRYRLSLREGAPAGEYRLLIGMYNPASGERLPALSNRQPQPNNAIELTKLLLSP